MRAIVGLRNPGPDYEGTRHNVGAEVVETLAARHGARLRRGPLRLRADVATIRVGGEPVVLALPRTFMNMSGGPVRAVCDYHGVEPADLLVAHDDIDLPFGKVRLQFGRGHGGHNGVRSVVEALGTKDFWRLKVGVGRPPGRMDPADYVLARFRPEERAEMDIVVQEAADVAERWVTDPEAAQAMAAEVGRRA